jgi:hypothetical protein
MGNESNLPSQITNVYWLYAERKVGNYPAATENCGKWLLFSPIAEIDAAWKVIKTATENGVLGSSSKVATAKPNPNATDNDTKVICVYTYDCFDMEDVMRIREELRNLGFRSKIPYKTDKATISQQYQKNGSTRISLYYM